MLVYLSEEMISFNIFYLPNIEQNGLDTR